MGCGKTTHLLQTAYNYESKGLNVCVIKPRIDTKNDSKLLSRIGIERKTDFTFSKEDSLSVLMLGASIYDLHCILIDEAQFMTPKQVDEILRFSNAYKVPVIAYGLRLNAFMTDEGFEGATRLLQVADKIEEIELVCCCGKKATRNCRFSKDDVLQISGDPILIDDGKSEFFYKSLCSECYLVEYHAALQKKK